MTDLVETGVATDDWTTVIRPYRGWFDLRLGELWQYKYLIWIFVWRDFSAAYRQTVLGPLWFLLQPLLTTLVFTFIFGQVAKLPTDGHPQVLFYFSGTIVWGYFAMCFTKTSGTFVDHAGLFGKVYFPRLVTPVSVVISNVVHFVIQFSCFLVLTAAFLGLGALAPIGAGGLLLPVFLFILAGLGLGFGIIVSSLTTRYQDLRHLVQFGTQLWMYATPVVYPLSLAPEKYRWLILLNPITPVVEAFRQAFLGGTIAYGHLGYSIVMMFVVLGIGLILFNRVEATFIDTV